MAQIKNPMCEVFPRVASCTYWRYGSGGGQTRKYKLHYNQMFRLSIECIFLSIFLKHTFLDEFISELQALCILSLNIVIDKVYLILWYWYLLVTLLGVIRVLCRVVQILSPQMRYWLMKLKMHR